MSSSKNDSPMSTPALVVGITSVILGVNDTSPLVFLADFGGDGSLPYGAFDPVRHRTLELAMRDYVQEQAGLSLGYVEQLYTFGNRHRDASAVGQNQRQVTVSYLALVSPEDLRRPRVVHDADWYTFFPWEDHRSGRPDLLDRVILPQLEQWIREAHGDERAIRADRTAQAFGINGSSWDMERVLSRYELLYEAGLVLESYRDLSLWAEEARLQLPITRKAMDDPALHRAAEQLGRPMAQDHRRILASAMTRIRGKVRYRPVVFELMPPEFTLLDLQRVVEALGGVPVHKQNFRRSLLTSRLVEETGEQDRTRSGRPAALYRFRREVLLERPAPGVGFPRV